MNTTFPSSIEECGESSLYHIRSNGYLLCRPPSQIQALAKFMEKMERDGNKDLFQATLGHPTEPHPPIQYRIAFVKHIIKQLESREKAESAQLDTLGDEEEEEEDTSALWYKALESLSGEGKQTEQFYRLYDLPDNCGLVKIFENENAFVAEGTTGLITWEASLEMAKWLCGEGTNEEVKRRKWVIELGCGSGLLAIAVSRSSVFPHLSRYIASDGSSSALSKCKTNLEANFGDLKADVIQVEEIDWMRDGPKFKKVVRNLSLALGEGVLFGADIVFDPSLIEALVELIQVFLQHHQKSIAFIACTIRNQETLEVLKRCLGRPTLQFQEIYKWGDDKGIIYKLENI